METQNQAGIPSSGSTSGPGTVGALFVHGIGVHERGANLARFADELERVLELSPGSCITRTSDVDGMVFEVTGVDEPQTVVVREAVWDDQFPDPPLRKVVVWMVAIVPWLLHREAFLWSARRERVGPGAVVGRATSAWSVGVFVFRFVVLSFLALLLQIAVLCSLLFVWIPWVGARLRTVLTAIVGDSYALVGDEAAFTSMADHVRLEIDRLSAECDRVLVVAHSQGSAVVHKAFLGTPPPGNLSHVVTLGAGLGKLIAIREIIARPAAVFYWTIARIAFVGAAIFALSRETSPATELPSNVGFGMIIVAALAPAWGVWRSQRMTESVVAWTPGLGEYWQWIDLWSAWDLVPDGRLRAGHQTNFGGVVTAEVVTTRNPFSAHTSYLGSSECRGVLHRLATDGRPIAVSREASVRPTDTPSRRHQKSRRFAIGVAVVGLAATGVALAVWLDSMLPGLRRVGDHDQTLAIVDSATTPAALFSAFALLLVPGIVIDAVVVRKPGSRSSLRGRLGSMIVGLGGLAVTAAGLFTVIVLLHSVRSTSALDPGDCFVEPAPESLAEMVIDETGEASQIQWITVPCDELHEYELLSVLSADPSWGRVDPPQSALAQCPPEHNNWIVVVEADEARLLCTYAWWLE